MSEYTNSRDRVMGKNVDRRPWTNEETDTLLEGFLVHQWPLYDPQKQSDRDTYVKALGRFFESVDCRLWKLFANYGTTRENTCTYTPIKRTDRTGSPWTRNDLFVIAGAVAPSGMERWAHLPTYLSKILGRDEQDIRIWMTKYGTECSGGLLGTTINIGPTALALAVRGRIKKLIRLCSEPKKGI